jgi:broad specificity phosphatase PhoE
MENESRPGASEDEHVERFGRDVEIRAIFMRHGEKGSQGELTERGQAQSAEFGEGIKSSDAIKGYSSPVKRVVETVERVIKSAPHGKKLTTRIRTEIGIPPSTSKEFLEKYRELEERGPDAAAEWHLSFGVNRPDAKTPSPHENAGAIAYILNRYIRMTDKLYTGSKVDLINGTHQGFPEALLKEILIRQEGNKTIRGFEKLEEIGGALRPTEGMEFTIKTDENGNKVIKLDFRGKQYDLDMSKLTELAEEYTKRHAEK